MSKMFFKMGLGLLAVAGLVWPAAAALPGMTALHGHVPAVVSQLAATGRLAATNRLSLAIGLPLHNQAGLDALLQQINDPTSPSYHHYLTPDQFATQFSPTPADYQAVLDFARTNGLTVTRTHANRMVVDVDGKVADIEKTFHVNLRTYHHPKEKRDFFAPDAEPSVDANLPILSVQGMNNYVQPHPFLERMPASKIKPGIGSAPGGGYLGSDFRNAYAPGTALNGSGQIVGLLQFDGYYASDITTYEGLAGLPNVPLQNVLLDGFNGSPGANNDEVCLDIETAISMAPGLSKVVVFEAGPTGNADDILSSMAASNTIKQFSASWGYPVDATTEQLYQQLAVQGQTFLNASGDGDAWVGPIAFGSCEDPNITIVGGTTLTMNGVATSYASEKVWNWGFAGDYIWNPDGYAGSSGGISTDVNIPSWQQGISMATNHGSTTRRNVPDVALTGDNVFVVSSGGSQGIFGGTSCASPLWAGFMALVNQQAAINAKPSVGFLAPAVYALAKTASYTNYFHDTTAGDNTWDQSLTNFFAVPGYDLATGLGTPNGTNLINALAGGIGGGPIISAPLPPWGNTLSVMNGGNPNGAWFLFVQDDKPADTGIISNGWSVALTTESPVGYAADNQVYTTPASVTLTANTAWPVTLAVTNYGPSASTNVYVTDTLPVPGTGVTLVSSNATAGSVKIIGDTLTWTVGNLAVNAGAGLTLNFYANSAAFGLYTNTAQVNATTTDPNPDDNTSAATLLISGPATPPQLTAGYTTGTGAFHLSVTGVTGQSAIIQASTNLVSWFPVYTNVIPFNFTNFDSTNYLMRFYRVVVGP
jgi:uncharacterized repeat protein (TIGR01451 family)